MFSYFIKLDLLTVLFLFSLFMKGANTVNSNALYIFLHAIQKAALCIFISYDLYKIEVLKNHYIKN